MALVGSDDDHSSMQRFLFVKSQKIGAIVGYKCVVLGADRGDEMPVFRPTETEIIDMICYVPRSMGQFN